MLGGGALTFGEAGLTLVYGDNGSGKSGYARLVKEVAEARHREQVLPNAFIPGAARSPQQARIRYIVGEEQRELTWPNLKDPSTRSIHFHDEACGDQYLRSKSELSYQPSAIRILINLIAATDALKAMFDERLRALASETLPTLSPDTPSATFLTRLDRTTTAEQIETACHLPNDPEQKLAALVQETSRLDATDPGKERARLQAAAEATTRLADHFEGLTARLGDSAEESLRNLDAEASRLRAAADLASKISFADEPLSGVGTEAWRTLWNAAETYSQAHAYSDVPFPATDAASRCVLCQQELTTEAGQRLSRFHAFVHDKTEADATAAELRRHEATRLISGTEVSPVAVSRALTTFKSQDEAFTLTMTQALEVAEQRKNYLLSLAAPGEQLELVQLSTVDSASLRKTSADFTARASAVDYSEFKRLREQTNKHRTELAALIELAKYKEALRRQVLTLAERHRLVTLRDKIGTGQITMKIADLTRRYAAAHVNDRFIRECQNLCVEKVYLGDLGGSKGKLHHKPELLGAVSHDSACDVLSEGEKTALGLAGLFTEAYFDESKSALVLDDPVSSLSHARRKIVARRVVEVAKERQVIVFTHDLTFLGYLAVAAKNKGVAITERCIERTGGGTPGHVLDGHPWKAKDAKKRFGELAADLARIKKEKNNWGQEDYLRATSEWAGNLSETYERVIRSHVANPLVDRATTEVRPKMFRMLAQITAQDNEEFQEGYGVVSEWAKRHDKSEDANFTPPTTEKMQEELDRAKAWFERIKSYQN